MTTHEAEQHLASEWWNEAGRLGWYIALLNRSLNKLTGLLGLRLDRALPVARYSPAQLARQLGAKWLLIGQDREEHITPAGRAAFHLDRAATAVLIPGLRPRRMLPESPAGEKVG